MTDQSAPHDPPADPPEAATDADADAILAARTRRQGRARADAIARRRALISRSGLFDAEWYRRHHPPARDSDLDPLDHYLVHGVGALAAPGPMFDAQAYLRQAWQLQAGQDDPLADYLETDDPGDPGRRPVSVVHHRPLELFDRLVEPLLSLPATSRRPSLAVVVHVFYLDLLDEILDALALLPYRFSLLVTTDAAEKAVLIEAAVGARALDARLRVVVCGNRGRNFGPFLLGCREIVAEHELVLHLHTKKSLFRGAERTAWRRTLLRTLLPARGVINGLIERFVADPALGVLTAAPGEEMRYWGFHWLSSRHQATPLFERLGLRSAVPQRAFDYPVAGMFWARTRAIAPLLRHDWQPDDFPPELGQTDGTLMHAIERSIVLMAAEQGCGFTELDYEQGLCRPGWSSRNIDQYRAASEAGLLDTIDRSGTVSFDLFDTLLSRICLSPGAVHRMIGFMAGRRFAHVEDYVARRRAAEDALRAELDGAGDVDLDAIHARFARDAGPECNGGWSEAAIAFVQRQEVELDQRTLRPRAVLLDALRHARQRGHRVVITSDSYLPRRHFDALLAHFGIGALVDEIYLSSERGARKDRGDLWQLVAAAEAGAAALLHVGDNEQSDIQRTADAGIRHFHVQSPADLFALHGLVPGEGAAGADPGPPLGDEILLGPAAAALFNSPFLDRPVHEPLRLDQPEQAGAVLFGPLLFAFVAWLVRHPATRHLDQLFFVAREGYFLKRLYDAIRAASGRADLPASRYFHSSRRAALGAAQGRGFDPEAVLRGAGYHGSLQDFLLARIGYVPDPALGHRHSDILLPRDNDLVRCLMELMQDGIEAHGDRALLAFTAYAEASGLTADARAGFVDVGYSGTMQAAIQTALGRPLIGLYMGVSEAASQVRAGGGHAFGAFADGNVDNFTGGYGMMLEALLTAPHGQVIGYDDSLDPPAPLFRHDGMSQRVFPMLERIYQGAEDYAVELVRCWGPDVLELPFRPDAATAMLHAFRAGRIALSPELMAALSVEDDFCGNGEIAVFSILAPPPRAKPADATTLRAKRAGRA